MPKYNTIQDIDLPHNLRDSWQKTVNILATVLKVPAALIMRVHDEEIEVFISSQSKGNVYEAGERAKLDTGLYCETVMDTRKELLVANALTDPVWDHNPDIKLGMISYCGLPITWPNGEMFGTICVLDIQDNSYSKFYRELLEQFRDVVQTGLAAIYDHSQSDQKFAAAFHAAGPLMTISRIDNGSYEEVNDSFVQVTGYSREEAVGKTSVELGFISAEDREHLKQILINEGQVRNLELKLTRKDGSLLHCLYNGEIIRYDDQNHLLSIAQDITERKVAQDQLLEAKAEADRANKAKSEFLASMSHELRTPLNAVLGYAQMLQLDPENTLSAMQHEHADSIIEGGTLLLELVNEILDLARVEADQIELMLDEVNANDVVSECISLIAPIGEKRNIHVIDQFSSAQCGPIRTDARRFKQCLINLLSNAIKFNKDNGTVTVSGEETADGFLRLSVQDTGIGIAKADYDSVFYLFHRLDADPMITREGTGIGLTVSKLIVERMGGVIGFDSEEGVGTTFCIKLPLVSNKNVLIWTEAMKVGVDALDKDHQVIAKMLNRLANNDCDNMSECIAALIEFAAAHFKREETVLAAIGYPNIDDHAHSHAMWISEMSSLAQKWTSSRDEKVLTELRKLLHRLLFTDILHIDSDIAVHARGKKHIIQEALK